MKKVIVSIVIICTIALGVLFIQKYVNMGKSEQAKPVEEDYGTQLRYTVSKGYVDNTILMDGIVTNENEEMFDRIQFEITSDNKIDIRVDNYQEVKKGDCLFTIDEKRIEVPFDGMVKECSVRGDSISAVILNYEKLSVFASVNYVHKDKIKVGDTISLTEKNPMAEKKEIEEKVVGFGFDVNENMIDVQITNTHHFLPGTEFVVKYKYVNAYESIYVLKSMVQKELDDYFVYVEKNGVREKRVVTIGTSFLAQEGNVQQEFVEIVSGLSEGEKIVIDVIENNYE